MSILFWSITSICKLFDKNSEEILNWFQLFERQYIKLNKTDQIPSLQLISERILEYQNILKQK